MAKRRTSSRRRILALPDRTDWALGFICQDLAKYLEATHEIDVRVCPKAITEHMAEQYDAIYIVYAAQYTKIARPIRRRKVIAGVHSYMEYQDPMRARNFFHRLKTFASLGCLAPGMKADLCRVHHRVFWTPYGVSDAFSPSLDGSEAMPDGRLRVGWAGNPNWGGRVDVKNFDTLRRVTDLLGPTAELKIASNLSHIQMPDFYRNLDVLVVTSRSEGAPLPLLEALCCGIPVISTRVGLADLHVQHGHNGWLFDGTDAGLFPILKWLAGNKSAVEDAKFNVASRPMPLLRWPEVAGYWKAFFDSV